MIELSAQSCSSDFRHKNTKDGVWADNLKTPEYVKEGLEMKTPRGISRGSLQHGSCSFGSSKAGNAVNKGRHQLDEVKDIHADMVEIGGEFQLLEINFLIDMYVKCGSIMDARHVFDNMMQRDVASWNIMILGYAKHEEGAVALELYELMFQQGVQPSARTFVAVLKTCCGLAEIEEGKQVAGEFMKVGCLGKGRVIHSQAVKAGFELNMFVGNTLVDMYVKCRSMEDAWHTFDTLPHRDVVSWTAMISGYARKEEGAMAMKLYERMHQEGIRPNAWTFVCTLKACSSTMTRLEEEEKTNGNLAKAGCLETGRAIHSQLLNSGFELDVFVGTALVDMYTRCGSMEDAKNAFDELPHHDVISWTAMIFGYAKQEEGALALELYEQMHQEGVEPNARTFVCALKACSSLSPLEERKEEVDGSVVKVGCIEKGRAIHSQILRSGFKLDVSLGTTLVEMYARCGSMQDAEHVLDELPYRDAVSWNAVTFGYVMQEEGAQALELYAQMLQENVQPNKRAFDIALKACSSLAAQEEGKQVDGIVVKVQCLAKGRVIHSDVLKSSYELDGFVGNTLVYMYVKCGSMQDAWHVFDGLPNCDVVSWNAMIMGYAKQEEGVPAMKLYAQMCQEGVMPDHQTFVFVLKACSSLAGHEERKQVDGKFVKVGCLNSGRALHSQLLRRGFESDIFVGTTLVDLYAKSGSMEDAQHTFDELPYRDAVSWNAIISGYAESEESEKAFKLYAQMQERGLLKSGPIFVSLLKACGNTATLEIGKELHAQICVLGLETTETVATSLIDMYAKCGSMVDAQQLFDALPTRDVITWSALLGGYASQGESELVFDIFDKMRQEGIQPDAVTFLSVLTVCSHVGLLDKGQEYFEAMNKQYGIIPTVEHYSCMVDLLGRAGLLEEAVDMVEKTSSHFDIVVWLTVLGACRKWKNVVVGRYAFDHAVRLDEKLAAPYVLMSNIYADALMWEDCDKIRVMRKRARAWKKQGKSWWTDPGGVLHTFSVADRRHPQSEAIYAKLKELSVKMKENGYVPDLGSVLQPICDDKEEDALCGHSGKLAIACALINTPEGTPICNVQNLKFCNDCHAVTAFISKIEQRNIICRDTSRFHNFKNGKCSCTEYS